MNKLLFLLVVMSSNAIHSQSYTPLLNDLNEWHFTSCYFGCLTDVYYTDGDTLVNGKNYKILDGYHYINRNLLLREDVGQKKVYLTLTQPQFEEDILLYDFSLTEGDSIQMRNPLTPFPNQAGYFTLDSIRMLTQDNGIENKHFYFSPSTSNQSNVTKTEWIEGIGSVSLINAPSGEPNINGVGQLSCAFKDVALYYSNLDSITECEPLLLSVNEASQNKTEISLVSLPDSNRFILSNAQEVKSASVFSLNGKSQLNESFQNQHEIELDLSQLKNGLYIIVLQLSRNKRRSFKVLVN